MCLWVASLEYRADLEAGGTEGFFLECSDGLCAAVAPNAGNELLHVIRGVEHRWIWQEANRLRGRMHVCEVGWCA